MHHRWVWRSWFGIATAALALLIGVFSLLSALGSLGRPFAGFFYGPNLLVSITQRESWPGVLHGIRSLDHIVKVNGVSVHSGEELARIIAKSTVGDELLYEVERSDRTVARISVPISLHGLEDFIVAFLAPFLLGVFFLLFGLVLYLWRPTAPGSWINLLLSICIASFLMTLYEAYTTGIFFRVTLLYPLIGAFSAHLFSEFFRERRFHLMIRVVLVGLYMCALSLIVLRQMSMMEPATSELLSRFSSAYVLLVLVVDSFLLVRAYQLALSQRARDRIKVLGIGLLIASSLVAFWSLNFLRISKTFYLDQGILIASVFPVFMSYAILRRNVFDLDRVIRLTLSYGIAAFLILGFYVVVVGGLREWMFSSQGSRYAGVFLVIAAALGASLFGWIRPWLHQKVSRFLFRQQHDLSESLLQLDQSLRMNANPTQTIEMIGTALVNLFEAERGVFIHFQVIRFFSWEDPPSLQHWMKLFEGEGLLEHLRVKGMPLDLTESEENEPDRFGKSRAALRANGIEMLVPFVASSRLMALFGLGKKRSLDPYDSQDVRVLKPIALRLGTVLENEDLNNRMEQQGRLVALGKMSSIMIHDIKNPLSTIRSAAGSLKRRFKTGDPSFELASMIEEEVDRMNNTVAEILTYAKPAGLALTKGTMNGLASEIARAMQASYAAAKVELKVELSAEDCVVVVDPSLFRRAVENLLINAKEASKPGDVVYFRTALEGENGLTKWVVTVEDVGPGMEPAVRERIFEPFFTTKAGGTGLGLALVKQIVEQHEGTLDLESKLGSGSRFTLRFPHVKEA